VSSPRNKKTDPHVSVTEWFEDERFWKLTYPFIFAEERFAAAEAEVADDWYRIRSRWLLIRDQKVTEASFDTALYSGRELADLLKIAGFEKVKLFGSLQGGSYDLNGQRLVAVAMKPR
jgi:hypothetical protein